MLNGSTGNSTVPASVKSRLQECYKTNNLASSVEICKEKKKDLKKKSLNLR